MCPMPLLQGSALNPLSAHTRFWHPSVFNGHQWSLLKRTCCYNLICRACSAGELYTRPPNVIVGTAFQRCARGDWEESQHDWANHVTWLSVYNKLDYVRLHAASLHVYALWVRRSFWSQAAHM